MKKEPDHNINDYISAPVVRVVGEGMEPTIMDTRDALKMAYDQGLDLVEISPNAQPPVCKIIDYQKFTYELKKKQKEMKAKSSKVVIKEIRLTTGGLDIVFRSGGATGLAEEMRNDNV